jgi:hypothetical protein
MSLTGLEKKLLAAGRRQMSDGRVPHGFARRVMARLPVGSTLDQASLWARALWRSALACLAVLLLLGAVSLLRSKNGGDLGQDFETTMLASADLDNEAPPLW